MAALQKIRSTSWILILMGVGLFLFLLTMVLDQNTLSVITNSSRNAGEVNGQKLSAKDYFDEVNEALEVEKIRNNGSLTEEQQQQIRDDVWQQHVQYSIVKKECDAFGFIVTEAEVQQALREGTAGALRNMVYFVDQQTGRFDYKGLQEFFKQAPTQATNPQVKQQLDAVTKLWAYTDKVLRRELLFGKYANLLQSSFTSNKLVAKANFDARNTQSLTTLAVLPFSSISDEEVKPTDAELQAAYKSHKELFRLPSDAADVKYVDVAIKASAADKAALSKEMNEVYAKLQAAADPGAVVNASKSSFRYANLPLTADAFPSDIAAQLDSMAVGSLKAPYTNVADNTMNIIKLISKVQAPDSVNVYVLSLQDADAQKLATRTDSVLKALNGGAKFADIAKRYGQRADSTWITSQFFNAAGGSEENIKLVNTLYNQPLGTFAALDMNGVKLILKVAERKDMKAKYNAAVVKVPINFSSDTYQTELAKFNRFVAANRTLADLDKNAAKEGYALIPLDKMPTSVSSIGANGQFAGVSGSKEAVRWVFDTADENEVSPVYEVGAANDHLLVVALVKKHKSGYIAWDDAQVKPYLTALVKSEKKGQKAAAKLAGVSTIEAAKAKGAQVVDYESNFVASGMIAAVQQNEPALDGAIAATAQGKTTPLVIGKAGAYLAKVKTKTRGQNKFDANSEMLQLRQQYMQLAGQQIFSHLSQKAKIVDTRYKF